MRSIALASVAAAALIAGTIAVSAQGTQDRGGAPAAAPAEKMAPSMEKKGTPEGSRSQAPGRSTTGQAPGQERGSQLAPGSERGGQKNEPRAGQGGRSTTGQGTGSPGTGMERSAPGQNEPRAGQGERGQTQMNRDQTQPRAGQGPSGQQTGQGTTGTSAAALTTEQRTHIRETVLKGGNVNRVSKVDFSLNVGTAVPRSVHLVTVPETIVTVHPAWRGFLYFVVNDEIIIVEPRTLEIVAVVS